MTQYPPVTFWTAPPTIDGMLSPEKAQLPERRFAHVCKMAPENPDYPLSYRLAYGPGFFYLYIQVDAETLICRDRGFQNGDGLVLTLAKPQPAQAPTAEFYMLGFWPQDDLRQHAGQQAVGRLLWGHNGDFPFLPLDKDTQFAAIAQEAQLGFELCLPWSVVYPYHPWLSEGLGFDLFFAKAVGETQSNIYTAHLDNLDKIVPDAVQYAVLDFAPPDVTERAQVYVTMDRNAEQGHTISVQIAVLNAAPAPISLILDIHRGKSHRIETQQAALDCPAGLSAHHMTLDTQRLTSGSYQVRWHTSASEAQGAIDVTIRPQFDGGALKRRLVRARANLADGSYHTLLFEIDELAKRVVRLAPDSTCPDLQGELAACLDRMRQVELGIDIVARRIGTHRRAFRSKIDGTLQPYTVHLPADSAPEQTYPLLVFLHGSERNDRALANHLDYVSTADFITLAPKGRGTANAYTIDHAQKDIEEAVADVCRNYPIDPSRIVLAGFSMGGYGVYRTHYETPAKYCALAVFCGIPDLARKYVGQEGHPDFLQDAYLAPFKDVPMFVYHGAGDRNAPFEKTVQVVEKLRAVGARVYFCPREGQGHGAPDAETIRIYHQWLKTVIDIDKKS